MARHDTWMPLYIGDYMADTIHLTTRQHGAYLLLLMAAWKNKGFVGAEHAQAITKLSDKEWKADQETLADFFIIADGLWCHKRVMAEADKAARLTQTRGEAGSKGAAKRWQSHKQTDAPSQSQSQETSNDVSPAQARTPRKTRIPEDWKADAELTEYARQQGCTDPADTFERFKLHHSSKGTLHQDWRKAAMLWCRNEKNFSRPVSGNGRFVSGNAPATAQANRPEDWGWKVQWHREKGIWNPSWGPPPGQPGCFVPREFLA